MESLSIWKRAVDTKLLILAKADDTREGNIPSEPLGESQAGCNTVGLLIHSVIPQKSSGGGCCVAI